MIATTAHYASASDFGPVQRGILGALSLAPAGAPFGDLYAAIWPGQNARHAGTWLVAKNKLRDRGWVEHGGLGFRLTERAARSSTMGEVVATPEARAAIANINSGHGPSEEGTHMHEQISGAEYPHNATLRTQIPQGDEGVEATIEAMRAVVHHATGSPVVQSIAARLAARAARKDRFGQLRAVRDWARRVLLFKPDGFGQETLRIPEQLVAEIAAEGKTSADCDDSSMLIASLLLILGWRTAFVVIATRKGGPFVHVFPGVIAQGQLVAIDAQEGFAIGTEAPSHRRRVFEVAHPRRTAR